MNILLALTGGFASGIFFRSLFHIGWPAAAFALMLATIFIVVPSLFEGPRRPFSTAGAVFCIFIALGVARAALAEHPPPQAFAAQVRERVSYEGVVADDPDLRDSSARIPVRVSENGETTTVLAVVPRVGLPAVGDRVRVSGTLLSPEPFAAQGGRTFRYDKYLEKDDIYFLLSYASIRVEERAPWYAPRAAAARIKHWFLAGLSAALPEPEASLAGGILVGGKSGLGGALERAFMLSGLVQIVVLSGYNVMVVAEWVMAGIALTRLARKARAGAGAFAVLAFVAIAGAPAAAIRAAFMAMIALYARATGRSYAAGRALLATIFLMLLWNPLLLAFDPGFALSVAATAGLIWLAPIIEVMIERVVTRVKRIFGASEGRHIPESVPSAAQRNALRDMPPRASAFWGNALATTVAAQVAVLPLLLYFTGNLSLIAIPANLVVMPFVSATMGFSALAGIAGALAGSAALLIASALALPAYALNAFIIFVARESAALPLAALAVGAFPFWVVLAAYAALIYFAASTKRFSTTLQLRFSRNAST